MSEIDRLYSYKSLFLKRRIISQSEILSSLEISTATFKRDLTKLRDRLNLPIVYDRTLRGYRLDKERSVNGLSSVIFSKEEILVFSTIQYILTQFEPYLFNSTLKPLKAKIEFMLNDIGLRESEVIARIKFLYSRKRKLKYDIFEMMLSATFNRKKLSINYIESQSKISVDRTISPQQLIYYKDNWYVDAWCHYRNDVRTFAIDAIHSCTIMTELAKELNVAEIKKIMRLDYGIFMGQDQQWAKIKINSNNASWVIREEWHANQKTHLDGDGWLTLDVPYSDTREILAEILKLGHNAIVLAPLELKNSHMDALKQTLANYSNCSVA
jgi:predicted DNA-binding transcriptional regulator YafY